MNFRDPILVRGLSWSNDPEAFSTLPPLQPEWQPSPPLHELEMVLENLEYQGGNRR